MTTPPEKHTPGTWHITQREGEALAVYDRLRTRRIATVPHPDRTEANEENSANAALIAAAPIMLHTIQLIHANAESPEWIQRFTASAIQLATGANTPDQ